jgi:hypothetical protein
MHPRLAKRNKSIIDSKIFCIFTQLSRVINQLSALKELEAANIVAQEYENIRTTLVANNLSLEQIRMLEQQITSLNYLVYEEILMPILLILQGTEAKPSLNTN